MITTHHKHLIERMSEAASKATPGQWHSKHGTFGKVEDPKSATVYACNDDLVYVARCDGSQLMFKDNLDSLADADFIAAANPANVLKLLEAHKVLMDGIRDSVARADDYGDSHCSQPIRQALSRVSEILSGGGE